MAINRNKLKNDNDRRIAKLYNLFSEFDVDITGNIQYPSIILDGYKLLHTYINNFDLYMLDDFPTTGYRPNTLKRYKISEGSPIKRNDSVFKDIISNNWTKIYTVRHLDTNLYLAGYKKIVSLPHHKGEKLPLFSTKSRKFFTSYETARDILDLYPNLRLIIDL